LAFGLVTTLVTLASAVFSWVTNVWPAEAGSVMATAAGAALPELGGRTEAAEISGMGPRLAAADDVAQNSDTRRHDLC
jgi:hypothetical protein